MNGDGLSTAAKIQNSLGYHDRGRVALFTCLMAACLAATSVPALAQSYTITDLGAIPANCLGDCSQGYGINNNGQVTGYNNPHGDAGFLTSPPYSNPLDLGSLGGGLTFGLGINSKGQVTGYSYPPGNNNYHAFRISPPYNSMTDIGAFSGGISSGQGINDSGQITGSSFLASRVWHAFFWDGTLHDLGTLGGDSSFGNGINASGQITGSADKARGVITGVVSDAFLYTPAKGTLPSSMIDLGDLGGGGSKGFSINNSGQITGDAFTTPGFQGLSIQHAFLWDGTMHDLGTLGGNSFGRGINNLGQVTGYADNGHAFLYTPGTGMVDLNTLLPSGSGWTLLNGNSINDAGQITGQGINPSGAHHAFVLTPPLTPPPGGATISGSAVGKPASGTADAVFTITVNNTTNGPLTVNFNTADGTAVAGIDYAATAGTLTFVPGVTAQPIQTQIIGGPQNSSNLFYSVQLRSAGNGNLLASGVGTILTTVPPPQIAFTLSASPQSLAMIASSSKSSDITLRSNNGIGGIAQLTAAWVGTAPNGVTFALLSSDVSIPPSGAASTTLTVTSSATPSPGTFTLRLTATSASGVTRFLDISIIIAATLPAPTCGCTATGRFKDPRVKGLVAPTPSGLGPGGFATVTGNLNQLTLTRNSDHKPIINSATNVTTFGFSPSGKLFMLITQPSPGNFSLDLYSVPLGGLVSRSSPLVTNPLSWGFSPDAENKFFIVTSSDNVNTHVDLAIYDTSTGKIVMPFSLPTIASVGNPAWSKEEDVESEDSDDSDNKQAGGWGFSPDGNTFLLSYKTGANSSFLGLWNLTHTTAVQLLEDTSHNVAGFWQFSPCSDLFMLVNQLGATTATTDSVFFYFTSNGRLFKQANLEPAQGAPSAKVTTQSDSSKVIQLVGMSLATIPSPQCSISGTMHSPANIALIDQNGRKTGFDSATDTAVNQIPGGTYTGIGSEPQTVAVPYIPGPYLIDAVGVSSLTSPQPYRLTIAAEDGSGDVFDSVDLSGIASAGSDRRIGFIIGNGPIQPQDATPACSTDVSGHVTIQRSGLTPKYGKVGAANVQIGYLQTLTLTNTAGTAINGPIEVAFGSLPSAVSVAYSNGSAAKTVSCNSPAGAPYLTLPASSLAPNTPVQLIVLFLDSTKTPFSGYTARVLAGNNP